VTRCRYVAGHGPRGHDRRVPGSPGRRRRRATRRGCGMTLRRFASLSGALVVAAIAALASYAHMRAVALEYGQPELIANLLPISVDGMMAVATRRARRRAAQPLVGLAGVLDGSGTAVVNGFRARSSARRLYGRS
jgi:hypothetical protein